MKKVWQPYYTCGEIVDKLYPDSYRQEQKNYEERQACSRALQSMTYTDRHEIELMADTLSSQTRGLGKTTALIILSRIGAYLAENSR